MHSCLRALGRCACVYKAGHVAPMIYHVCKIFEICCIKSHIRCRSRRTHCNGRQIKNRPETPMTCHLGCSKLINQAHLDRLWMPWNHVSMQEGFPRNVPSAVALCSHHQRTNCEHVMHWQSRVSALTEHLFGVW